MSLNNRLLAALGLLVLLLSMVGCARKSAEEGSRPPEVVAPPKLTPVDKVVDVVIGERRSIARAQVAALKLRGAPLATPEYPRHQLDRGHYRLSTHLPVQLEGRPVAAA